ncbi:MAG: nonstructural protein [Microvirus sp.]|nr:MAG: nonstructural protein [Microvirus sp.]
MLHAYTVYDRKALQYHAPWFAVTDGAAVRSFADLANDPSTTVGRHPGDYVLYRLGSYDDAAGLLLPSTAPVHVSDALPLVRAQPELPIDAVHQSGPHPLHANGKA